MFIIIRRLQKDRSKESTGHHMELIKMVQIKKIGMITDYKNKIYVGKPPFRKIYPLCKRSCRINCVYLAEQETEVNSCVYWRTEENTGGEDTNRIGKSLLGVKSLYS